ncbi:hypothetical protein F52700_6266 [Fusarium sp. NRRL 52700]|nr:hypothetical protein F52700_6266 [Fusarium sp. NRRL 52700]
MCKFDSSDEPGYIMIKWLLQKWIKELPEHTSGGPADPAGPSIATKVPALDTTTELHILHRLLGLSNEDGKATSEDSKGSLKPLLSPETVRWLASKELLSAIQKESITISTAPLLESFTISTTDQSSTEGNWSLSEDDKPFLRKVDVPIRLKSSETYEFLGYQRSVAEHLWNRFNSPMNPSFSLFEVSKAYLEDNIPAKSEFDWNFMAKIGICDSLRKSILNSSFSDIRSTASCEFWLLTAFEIRWQELNALNDDLLKVMKRTASTGGEQPTGSPAPSHDQSANTEQSQSSGHQDTAQPPAEQCSGEKEEKGPAIAIVPATNANEPGNEKITLWRGHTKTKIEEATKNGKLHVNKMLSLSGDFGRGEVAYFATRRNTAAQYGAFHASLSQIGTPPYLLQFQVGREWLKDLQHRCLWAGGHEKPCELEMLNCGDQEDQGNTEKRKKKTEKPSWEHVVFTCRRRDEWDPEFLEKLDLVIGHIAKFHDEEIIEMKSDAEITPEKLIVDDIPAVQYAFTSQTSQRQLEEEASGVKTERLGGIILRTCMDDCPGKPRVDHFRFINDLCQDCNAKLSGDSRKRRQSV